MSHRSFRLSPNTREPRRVIPRLRLLFTCAAIADLLLAVGVLGLATIVGMHTEFFRKNQPNWSVLIAFSVLVVFAIQAMRACLFSLARVMSFKFLVGRWMTATQADQFPGWFDRWPDSWLESCDESQSIG